MAATWTLRAGVSRKKETRREKKPAPIVTHSKLAHAAAAGPHNRRPPTYSSPTHCRKWRPLYAATSRCPPPHPPRLKVVNGARPRSPNAAAFSPHTTRSTLTAAATIRHQTRPLLPPPPSARCSNRRQPSAAILGCPPPQHSPLNACTGGRRRPPYPAAHVLSTTQSPHAAVAAADRHTSLRRPPSSTTQCGQRRPPPAATLGRPSRLYTPFSVGSGRHTRQSLPPKPPT